MKNNGRVFLRRLCICFILAVFLASLYPGFDVAYADLTLVTRKCA